MANLPLAFAELLIGAILVDAGIKGASPADVVKGVAKQTPFSTGTAASSTPATAGAGATATSTVVGSAELPQGTVGGAAIGTEGTDTASYPTGVETVKAPWNPNGKPIADWIAPILEAAANAGVNFTVSSGYRTDAEQTQIYNSGTRPAAVPISEGGSGSNHEGDAFPQGAVDIGTGATALSAWLESSPFASILVYAGSKDPVHFSHPHDGGY